ncbi:hypothetical protein DND132_2565 [Pseudodesulfovibrio mercurii]|uniref:SH3 domain-containing protein n=1 Tax=Pseudodesulfovibrio mercurii TaxID=641491 RepID=F0JD94_9BACT|nr:hypothetical protein [Pseudodesulfovibrio mercurii]EGB15768.1 hypothetical protein DND132_2565 [Pseudodesulfovibrio mercurii]
MQRLSPTALPVVLILACLLFAASPAPAFEVNAADVSGEPPFQALTPKPVQPDLAGYFQCADDAPDLFAYALVPRNELYYMYIKAGNDIRGWVPAVVDGYVIHFGDKVKGTVTLAKDGTLTGGLDGNPPTKLTRAK